MEYNLLRAINLDSQQWCVKVRVVRFSNYFSNEQPPRLLRLDFILLDEKGKAMEAQIPQRILNLFENKLHEGSIYYIRYFEVLPARSAYRPVDHPYMARFTRHTTIRRVELQPDGFPNYACSIVPFDVLKNRTQSKELLSDVIGLMEKCSSVSIMNTKTGPKALRNVHITNGRETAVVALWGQHAEQFQADRYMEAATHRPVVLLFAGVTSGWYDGRLALQGSPTCRWYADPDLPEATQLRDSYGHMVAQPHWIGQAPAHAPSGSITVAELALIDNPHTAYGARFTVTAKVKSIVTDDTWWYNACTRCNKRSNPNGDAYRCSDPKCSGTGAKPRYKLALTATDPEPPESTGEKEVEFICFGPTAEQLIGAPVESLIESVWGTEATIPQQIARLCGRRYVLAVSVSRGSLRRDVPSFKIDSVSSTPALPPPELLGQHSDTMAGPSATSALNTASPAGHPELPDQQPDVLLGPSGTASPNTASLGGQKSCASPPKDTSTEQAPASPPPSACHTPPPTQTPKPESSPEEETAKQHKTDHDTDAAPSGTKRQKKGTAAKKLCMDTSPGDN